MYKLLLGFILIAMGSGSLRAQFSLTGSTYTQNFDGLGLTTSSALAGGSLGLLNANLNGWYFYETNATAKNIITVGTGSSSTGDTYNVGTNNTSTDRSIGSLQSSGEAPRFGFWFQNDTGATITGLSLSYRGETWRIGATGRSDSLTFATSTDAAALNLGTWTDNVNLGYTNNSAAATSTAGGSVLQSANISGNLGVLSMATGSKMFLRWTDFNASGADDLLAINNFSLTATLAEIAASFTWTGTGSGATWLDGGAGSFASNFANNLNSPVTFSGNNETVTVSGTVKAGALDFQAANLGTYVLNGGTVEMGGSINVKSGNSALIQSTLAGTNGLSLVGGTLELAGANNFTGATTVSGGAVLRLNSDGNLGNSENDVTLNNGKLDVSGAGNLVLGAGRDIAGSMGEVWMTSTGSLQVNGSFNLGSTSLQGGKLDLRGSTRNVGVLQLWAGSTIDGSGAVSMSSLTSYHSGNNIFNSAVNLGSASVTIEDFSGNSPTTKLEGAVSLSGSAILTKRGTGILELNATGNSINRLQIGLATATMVTGGTVKVADSSGLGNNQLYFNAGTLEAKNNLSSAIGMSIGGRNNGAILTGADMTFGGTNRFYKAYTSASDDMSLTVNNRTTFTGIFEATGNGSGAAAGSATNIAFRGNGTLSLNGNASAISDNISVRDSLKLNVNGSLGSGAGTFSLASTASLGGSGTVNGAATLLGTHAPGNSPGIQTFANGVTYGASSTLVWELSGNSSMAGDRGLLYDGVNVTGGNFTVEPGATMNLVFNSLLAGGTASTVDWANPFWETAQSWVVVDFSNLAGLSTGSFNLGSVGVDSLGQSLTTLRAGAGFTISNVDGDIILAYAVPEPSSHILLALGMAGLIGVRAFGRKQG